MQDRAYHLRFRPVILYQQILLLNLLSFFKLHFASQILHLFYQHTANILRISFQNLLDFIDIFQIILVRLQSDAWSGALLDVILQANLELSRPYVLRRKVQVAGTQRI